MRRNTQRPGHPGHRFSAATSGVGSSAAVEGGSAGSGFSDSKGLVVPFWIGSRVAIEEERWKLGFMGLVRCVQVYSCVYGSSQFVNTTTC